MCFRALILATGLFEGYAGGTIDSRRSGRGSGSVADLRGGCGLGVEGGSGISCFDVMDLIAANLKACPMLSLRLRSVEKDFFRFISGSGPNGGAYS